ncbi:CHASE3 domain-containing protein [Sphingomonas sp. A2-49]|uniref:sensor histidine kinase n=1 Tax=Sphingomonas sp. A2-49 TaxID=1391375 RepID=UPI0021D1F448|nr:ATP-binding protein [Sphingomonas sp. A2-49]MCU6455223.1 CHASE3 domain-containing protein [Sphingomonas sp. A2-49]
MITTVRNRFVVSEGRFGRVLVTFMALGFLALVGAGIAAGWATSRNADYTRWVNHTYEVELSVSNARRLIEQGEASRRGYLLTGNVEYRDAYRRWAASLTPALVRLQRLTRDNPRQVAALRVLRTEIAALLVQRGRTMALIDAGRIEAATALFRGEASVRRLAVIRNAFEGMAVTERRLLEQRDAAQRANVRAFYVILAIAAVLLAFVALASLLTVLRYTRDLSQSRDTLRDFNARLEETVSERTADLSRANEEIQRFAYIVSHDLRSPLVNVMGFTAELSAATTPLTEMLDRAEAECPGIVREDARLAVREDLPEAIGFIRTSTQKMDRLINAILKLSREGRRVITPEPIDPAAVTETIAGSIRHLLDDRGVTLAVERPIPGLVTDRVALEQILSNLIENATKYLQPGRPGTITVSGESRRDRVILSVADNGRGIDPRDHQRIFDLFRRSGQQDQPGEGIGLAHVRALAYRLGGTIDVDSALGRGSTFRINLPKAFDVQDSPS